MTMLLCILDAGGPNQNGRNSINDMMNIINDIVASGQVIENAHTRE